MGIYNNKIYRCAGFKHDHTWILSSVKVGYMGAEINHHASVGTYLPPHLTLVFVKKKISYENTTMISSKVDRQNVKTNQLVQNYFY